MEKMNEESKNFNELKGLKSELEKQNESLRKELDDIKLKSLNWNNMVED